MFNCKLTELMVSVILKIMPTKDASKDKDKSTEKKKDDKKSTDKKKDDKKSK